MNLSTLPPVALESERALVVYELAGYTEGDTAQPGYQRLISWLERIDAELTRRAELEAQAAPVAA